jgi:hypothetical protein
MGVVLVGLLVVIGALANYATRSSDNGSPVPVHRTLSVTVGWSALALRVTNVSAPAGAEREVYINGQPPFAYKATSQVPAVGESTVISLMEFVDRDGNRFNPVQKAVTEAWVGGGGYDFEEFRKTQ